MTITKQDILQEIKQHTDLTAKDCEKMFNSIINHISQALINGESVKCTNFGTFNINVRPPRMGKHPVTGQDLHIQKSHNTYFKASNTIAGKINKNNTFF